MRLLRYRFSKYISFLIIFAASFFLSYSSFSEIKIKFIALNPSDKDKRILPIRFDLPQEIKPEDVINSGGLDIEYDVDYDCYYVSGEAELGPKEGRTYEIEVRDVWKISSDKLDLLRRHVEDKIKSMESDPSYAIAKTLKDSIVERLDKIADSQSEDKPINDRVEAFGSNQKIVETIENDILVLEGISEGNLPQEATVSIVVEIENPYDEPDEFPIKHYLLPEINATDVVDSAGLDIGYDNARQQSYLKGRMKLDPHELRKLTIKVKDIWFVKQQKLDSVRNEAKKITEQLVDTDFEKLGNYLLGEIESLVQDIVNSQSADLPLKTRIANYKGNLKKLEVAEQYLERLRSFMLKFELARAGQEGKPTERESKTEMTTGGGKAEGKGGGIGSGMGTALGKGRGQTQQQRGGGIQGIRGLKGIILVSRSIFKGWKPEIATTWFIIIGIIIFLFIFAAFFYFVWLIMSIAEKKKQKVTDTKKK